MTVFCVDGKPWIYASGLCLEAAALDMASGEVMTPYKSRCRHQQECLEFLLQIKKSRPGGLDMQLTMDDHCILGHVKIRR